ncbi:MAG TPA: ParB N-terminal domain-containing protein, partial [Desulfobacterales bacterium]|nr:ParB N-terminal domain-containing protein [Desulfobacterales bacterium]
MCNNKLEPLEWHTEQRRIQDLVPWNKNPRRMTEKQASDLRTSLERLNLMSIPVIDADNTIISGHQHMKIMQALGRGEEVIDVRVPNRKLTDDELKEANLRENKNLGEWDFDLLAEN